MNYLSSATGRNYPLEFIVDGELRQLNLQGPVTVTGADMYAACAVAGLGIVQVPRYRIADALRSGALEILLPDLPPPALPVSVLYPQSRQLSPRVRTVSSELTQIYSVIYKILKTRSPAVLLRR